MNPKYKVPVNVLIITIILLASCKREEFQWIREIGDITYTGNIVFLGTDEFALLKEVTDNGIVFSGQTSEIKKITDKSILVMGVSEKIPYGLLRKVITVQSNGTEVVISTTDAVLTDAVIEGTIKLQQRLLEKDFKLKSKVDGVLVKGPDKSFDGLAVTLDNLEIFKEGTKIVRLNGAIGISPEIDITIKVESNKISEINVVTTLNKVDEVNVSSNEAFSGGNEIVIAEFIHSPIVIDSLVFVPEVRITCGFDGTISCEVSSGVRQDRVITSKINYKDTQWSEDSLIHTESFDFIRPQITDNSDLKIFSGPGIDIKLFGIPVQTVKATGFFSLEAEKTGSPLWKLFIGSDGINTIKAKILGLDEDYSSTMAIKASEIDNANGK
jgi:hypothetical protein